MRARALGTPGGGPDAADRDLAEIDAAHNSRPRSLVQGSEAWAHFTRFTEGRGWRAELLPSGRVRCTKADTAFVFGRSDDAGLRALAARLVGIDGFLKQTKRYRGQA